MTQSELQTKSTKKKKKRKNLANQQASDAE